MGLGVPRSPLRESSGRHCPRSQRADRRTGQWRKPEAGPEREGLREARQLPRPTKVCRTFEKEVNLFGVLCPLCIAFVAPGGEARVRVGAG